MNTLEEMKMICRNLPFGYASGDDGIVVIDAEKGAYVEKMFEMALEGLSQNRIASFFYYQRNYCYSQFF